MRESGRWRGPGRRPRGRLCLSGAERGPGQAPLPLPWALLSPLPSPPLPPQPLGPLQAGALWAAGTPVPWSCLMPPAKYTSSPARQQCCHRLCWFTAPHLARASEEAGCVRESREEGEGDFEADPEFLRQVMWGGRGGKGSYLDSESRIELLGSRQSCRRNSVSGRVQVHRWGPAPRPECCALSGPDFPALGREGAARRHSAALLHLHLWGLAPPSLVYRRMFLADSSCSQLYVHP